MRLKAKQGLDGYKHESQCANCYSDLHPYSYERLPSFQLLYILYFRENRP